MKEWQVDDALKPPVEIKTSSDHIVSAIKNYRESLPRDKDVPVTILILSEGDLLNE